MFKIELGAKVTDHMTGFKGEVYGRAEYTTGCKQYLVVPICIKNDFKEPHWFDEDRLLASVAKKAKRGGPLSYAPPVS